MKVCVLIIVIVIQVITCEKAETKFRRKLIATKINENCKKIKCLMVEDPQCVRLRRHDLNLTFHMMVASKCELEYLKCHDDLEGKIVPLKFCGKHAVLTAQKHKIEQGTANFRPKRSALFSKTSTAAKSKMREAVNQEISKHQKIKSPKKNRKSPRKSHLQGLKRRQRKHETRSHRQMLRRNETRGHGHMQRKNQPIQKGLGKHARQSFGYFFSTETDTDFENEKKELEKWINGFHVNRDEAQHSQLEPKAVPLPKDFKHVSQDFQIEDKRWARPSFPMFSEETVNNYGKNTSLEIDKEQYAAACPTVCPSRDVMVCGMCQHGIYRTFSSDCHLRMYGCMRPKENVQLVSRVACVQSSPFLSEPGLQTQGRIPAPEDDDVVLRFIRCRDKGLLRREKTSAELRTKDPFLSSYTYVKAVNYYYKYHKTEQTWDESKKTCELEGASLYYPENETEYHVVIKFWKKYEPGAAIPWIHLGIKKFTNWLNVDGQIVSEANIRSRLWRPDNAGRLEDCILMDTRLRLRTIKCTTELNYICRWKVRTTATRLGVGDHKIIANGVTYVYYANKQNWNKSNELCERQRASLFYPVDSPYEVEYVYPMWRQSGSALIYLGIRRFTRWQTVDGKPISEAYVKWQPEQPLNADEMKDCVHMNLQGFYYDVLCTSENRFICKKSVPTNSPIPQHDLEDPRCNFEPAKETLKLDV